MKRFLFAVLVFRAVSGAAQAVEPPLKPAGPVSFFYTPETRSCLVAWDEEHRPATVTLRDVYGRDVLVGKAFGDADRLILHLDDVPPGVYVVRASGYTFRVAKL
jgi:hypothetical protein